MSVPAVSLPRRLIACLRALRAFSLPLSVLPVVAATALAIPPQQWDVPVLLAGLFAAAMLHLTGNLLNDYFDFCSGADSRVDDDARRPGRLLVRGELPPRAVLVEAIVCGVLAAPPTVWIVIRGGLPMLALAAVAVVGLYAYTGPPLKLKYRAMGEVVVFLLFGPLLMAAAALSQTGRVAPAVLFVSVPVGLGTAAVLAGNNVRDRQEDAAGRVRTLAGVLGESGGKWLYVALVVASAVGPAALAAAGLAPRLLLVSPALLLLLAETFKRIGRERIPNIDVRTANYQTALLVLTIAAAVYAQATGPG
ncbi:MAG: prenyltransferase [Phycisphaerae bacterium]